MDEITGAAIREARVANGLSQAELAEAVGVSQGAIGQWEREEFRPKGRHLNALKKRLGLLEAPSDKTGRDSDQFALRLPDGMRELVRDSAERNRRTMNAEMVFLIEQGMAAQGGGNSASHELLRRAADLMRSFADTLDATTGGAL